MSTNKVTSKYATDKRVTDKKKKLRLYEGFTDKRVTDKKKLRPNKGFISDIASSRYV